MNWSAGDFTLVPPGPTSVTSTVPTPAGDTAVTSVDDSTLTLVAGALPKLTAVTPSKLVPWIATLVPPSWEPAAGLRLVTIGT